MMNFVLIQVVLLFIPLCSCQNGKWTDKVGACIRAHNDWSGRASTFVDCQISCEEQSSFTCLSIDYTIDGNCHHSGSNRNSVGSSDFTQPCYNGVKVDYAERLDQESWTELVAGCIRGNNDWNGKVANLVACQKKCTDATDFTCLSIEYNKGSCSISRFNRNTVQPSSDYWQPCYRSGWHYAEPINAVTVTWTTIENACIRSHNIRETQESDIDSCRSTCIEEDKCSSVDFKDGFCFLNDCTRHNVQPAEDYTEPCYIPGAQYSEIDRKC